MYWEWTTLSAIGDPSDSSNIRSSVLDRLPVEAAKDVVVPVVRHIVNTLGISQQPLPSSLNTDREIEWCLQVICYGLSLPLNEHEIIKDCVSIYCEWMSCLAPIPKISVPKGVAERPNFYCRKMINHLYHLFTPRKGEGQDTINRQAVLCHRVLRVLENVIRTSEILEKETWDSVLLFLIAINDALLSPPSVKEDIGDQLCERVLSFLFEIWLLACGKCFPNPSLWKTLRESCKAWRHRSQLFDQWNRINLLLTARVLKVCNISSITYGGENVSIVEDDGTLIPTQMSDDAIVQTWFRFLHCVGNPVELTVPTIISQTQNFLQYAIASQAVVDPCQHPCLSVLPSIFHQAMRGIAALVDAFLGLQRTSLLGLSTNRSKDTSSIPSQSSTGSIISTLPVDSLRPPPALDRPKVNSILHVFARWLFEAALISATDGEVRRTSRGSAVPVSLPESIDMPHAITIDKYYQGRAEALGTLCRIFCSKKTGEEILPAYLSRFYISVRKGLRDSRQEVLNSILSNSSNLFKVDLDGVTVLLPSIVIALEAVLPNKDGLRSDLRRSAIQLLLSALPLPLHFLNIPIKDVINLSGSTTTFIQLKPRLANLLMNALQVETDSVNIQMLLGGLMMFVADISTFEDVNNTTHLSTESPTNLLSSENTSIRSMMSDYSNSFDEHTLGLTEHSGDTQFDSAHALFVRATYLVCHRLISTWKSDLAVSLAALELLNGLAKTKIYEQDPLECRRAVKWICDYVISQCSRPPPAHSKDLHSSIVAAFQSIMTWLTEHPYLLEDKECLCTVLEVVEYGISGTKSQGKPGEPIKLKDEKELKPVSLRVRDAAEVLLAAIFEQVGRHGNTTVMNSNSSNVDELILLNQLNNGGNTLKREDVVNHFRYFVIDHSILIALLESGVTNEQDSTPTVTIILRGPSGRHSWSMQLRHMPINKGKSMQGLLLQNNPGRPLPINDIGDRHNTIHSYFPENTDRISACKADRAIPSLDSASTNSSVSDQDSLEQSRLSIILENQIRLEKIVANMIREEADESYPNFKTEAQPPSVSQEFQTARLVLSHLGFISIHGPSDLMVPPKLSPIDSKVPEFIKELETLDSTSCRTNDTVHIFYVRAGQRKSEDILTNVQSRSTVHPHFLEFLLSLGWPVNVNRHSSWTGNVNTSWKRQDDDKGLHIQSLTNDMHGGAIYNGERQVLWWADVNSEVAFVVPTGRQNNFAENGNKVWNTTNSSEKERSLESGRGTYENNPTEQLQSSARQVDGSDEQASRAKRALAGKLCDTKIFVVWLESYEDLQHFPAEFYADGRRKLNPSDYTRLLHACSHYSVLCTYTGDEKSKPVELSLTIFIHALKNGLFRIHIQQLQSLRMGFPTPLIDGSVTSRRVLGNLERQTALNLARRKRLENENFQRPHVRRKLKIQEIRHKFPSSMSTSEFLTHFYQSPASLSHEKGRVSDNIQEDAEDQCTEPILL